MHYRSQCLRGLQGTSLASEVQNISLPGKYGTSLGLQNTSSENHAKENWMFTVLKPYLNIYSVYLLLIKQYMASEGKH